MFTVESDIVNKRLYVKVDFGVMEDDIPRFREELKKNVGKLDNHFTALLDLTKTNIFRSSLFNCLGLIGKNEKNGVMKKCALVMGTPIFNEGIKKQLNIYNYEGKVFDNIKDAEMFLNE